MSISTVLWRLSTPIALGAIAMAIGCTSKQSSTSETILERPETEVTEVPTTPPPEVRTALQTTETTSPSSIEEPAPPAAELSPEPTSPPECESPQTQTDMNICAGIAFDRADEELNRIYQNVIPQLDVAQRDRLAEAQLAWIDFRDGDCTFAGSMYEGGSIQPLIVATCKETRTRQRTDDLQAYLDQRPLDAVSQSYEMADDRLNQVYQQLIDNVRDDRASQLQTAELAWIEFRDRACDFEAELAGDGSGQNCLTRITENRSDRLTEALAENTR